MKRATKYKDLTPAQIEHRFGILGKKPPVKKEKPLPPVPKVTTRNEYMNNCMFWVNDFETGGCDKERLLKAVVALRNYCTEIINESLKGLTP